MYRTGASITSTVVVKRLNVPCNRRGMRTGSAWRIVRNTQFPTKRWLLRPFVRHGPRWQCTHEWANAARSEPPHGADLRRGGKGGLVGEHGGLGRHDKQILVKEETQVRSFEHKEVPSPRPPVRVCTSTLRAVGLPYCRAQSSAEHRKLKAIRLSHGRKRRGAQSTQSPRLGRVHAAGLAVRIQWSHRGGGRKAAGSVYLGGRGNLLCGTRQS